jgi:hypothetical protein
MYPLPTDFQAVLAALRARLYIVDVVEVCALLRHNGFLK